MVVIQHFFIPCFRRRTSIEQKACRMNHLYFFCYLIRRIQKLVIYWRCKRSIIAKGFILIRRVSDDIIKLHAGTPFLNGFKVLGGSMAALAPVFHFTGYRGRLLLCRPEHGKEVKLFCLRLGLAAGHRQVQAVHLPQVPTDDFGDGLQLLFCWLALPAGLQMLRIGQQKVDPRQQKIISLILIAVGRLHRMGGIFAPLVLCGGVLAYHTQLAVQNANAPGYRDHLAGGGIVPGRQKGGFAAGHLQAAALHILHPCRGPALASRELHRRFHRLPALGQLHRELPGALLCPQPTEPVGVQCVVHLVADPCGREYFALFAGALLLGVGLLHHPGQHHLVVGQPELLGGDLGFIRDRFVHYRLQLFRRVGGPDDVFTGGFIF